MLGKVEKGHNTISYNEKSNIISDEPSSKLISNIIDLKEKISSVSLGIPLVVLFFAIWEAAPRIGVLSPIFFPPFSVVIHALLNLILTGELQTNIIASLFRAFIGFFLGVIVAVPLGFIMGRYSLFEKITDLLIQGLRNTSQFALLPVFIMLLGIGEASKIAMTFNAAIWLVLINTISGVKGVDPLLIKSAISMGTSDKDLFKKIIFPASFPSIVAGVRLAIKSSLMSVIGAEMLGAKSGLGFLIQNSQLTYRIPEMYAGILVLTIFGIILNYILVLVEKKATSWKSQNENLTF
ncbi:MAG: ABC transporter permease [Candidatus Methanofastidiosa archaeon]|nr:ABC transporter permease [Candidatus Methanofastidiosa archaeon]